jgi:preprotein translocase subunit SecB
MSNETQAIEAQAVEAQFMIQRIYIKNLSFETVNTPACFQQQWEPELSLDVNTSHSLIDAQGVYEVVLSVTATVKNKQATIFLVEVQQAGIFTIQGAPEAQVDHLLGSFCPSILFPYAREAISAEVMRGSFPQLVLAPINFDALYVQQQEAKKQQTNAESESTTH